MNRIINITSNTVTSRPVTSAISALFYRQARILMKVIGVKCELVLGSEEFVWWVQEKVVNCIPARDWELSQKSMMGNDGIVEQVTDVVVRYFEVN